jgi:hypothetical protein
MDLPEQVREFVVRFFITRFTGIGGHVITAELAKERNHAAGTATDSL